jgi:methylthioribose-1-phosphate isomerase
LADPIDSQTVAAPRVPASAPGGAIGPNPAPTQPTPDPGSGADLGRRRFFRQFAGDIANTAATVVGAAQALQRTSAELAGALLDPARDSLVEHPASSTSTATASSTATVAEPAVGPLFRTSFQVAPGEIQFLDQRALPAAVAEHVATSAAEVTWAIRNEVVIGGPAIGQAAAMGLALTAARTADSRPYARRAILRGAASGLKNSAPTVASLGWAVDRVMAAFESVGELGEDGEAIAAAMQAAADAIVAEATIEHGALVEVGIGLIDGLPRIADEPLRLLVHGPSGTLAGGQFGTALAIAIAAHHADREVKVYVPEGRPGLVGARVSCWELAGAGVAHVLVPDAAAAGIVASGGIDAILVPADRVAVNGDVAAPIGSVALAAAADRRGIPFIVCVTTGSLDRTAADGTALPTGARDVPELARIGDAARAPRGTDVVAPLEDIIPAALVSNYIAASGLRRPPFDAVAG